MHTHERRRQHAQAMRAMELEVLALLKGVYPKSGSRETAQRYVEDGVVRHGSFRMHVTSLMRREFVRQFEAILPKEPVERFVAINRLIDSYVSRREGEVEEEYQRRVVCGA